MPYLQSVTPFSCPEFALQALADHLAWLAQEAGHAGERQSGEQVIELLYSLLDHSISSPAQAGMLPRACVAAA